jgi:sugar lactone lactonase YvrE
MEKSTEPAKPKPTTIEGVGFKTPESILYDAEQDVYLVSNINGSPLEADNNGFISKVDPDGKVVELKWIEGGQKDAILGAPKGMAISGELLYVADINFVRLFDRKTGEPKGKIGIGGATFLNGVATGPDGTVYVSDSGLKGGKEGLEPNGTDAVFMLANAQPKKLAMDKELGGPNGLAIDETGAWVVTFGSGELYKLTKDGKRESVTKPPTGALDGLVKLSDGTFLVSSWEGSAVYRGKPGGTFETVISDVTSPADIGFDSKRNRVLIPLFQKDAIVVAELASPPVPAPPAPAAAAPAPGAKPAATPAGGAAPAKSEPTAAKPAAPAKPAPAKPAP